MIFTIGYDGKGFTTDNLCKILDDAQAVLIDVRLTPFSRLKGWGSKQLIERVQLDNGRYTNVFRYTLLTDQPKRSWLDKLRKDK